MLDFAGRRLLMNAPLPALLEFEVLHGVGDVSAFAVNPGFGHGAG